ncbi:MAG: class I SAM-dependent RNA methyltransferase [Alsobacter sp.]
MIERLSISRLGQRGDGVAETPQGPVFVAGAVPGDTVTAQVDGDRGRLISVDTPSADRATPFCPLYGRCGGCATQHIGPKLYSAWKREGLVNALRHAGIDVAVDPLVEAHGEGRRRVTFHVRRVPGEGKPVIETGFMAARSHDIVIIDACPLLTPGLARAPQVAHAIGEALAGSSKPLDVQVTDTEGGLDVDVRGHGPASPSARRSLALLANQLDLARLSMHGDVIVERRTPSVKIGTALVVLPPGGFLQATRAGEDALGDLVTSGVGKAKMVADLFAGVGTLALRLAEKATVHAVESEGAAMLALDRAVRQTQGLRTVTIETRDLFRRPLLGPELARFDAVVFDPPRAGADAQAKYLAESSVPVVVAVSCNASTFARDAALLIGGGYTLARVTPVDQFLHSVHVELVGVFEKKQAKKRRFTLG